MGVLLEQWEGREHPNSPNPHSTNTGVLLEQWEGREHRAQAAQPRHAQPLEREHEGAPSDECFTRSRRRTRARLTHAARPPAQLSRRCSRRSVRAARSAAKSPYFADFAD